jgi:2-polyprenyl-3-methyl-5-hydroxy-6-metoxy-1,4-benzoquinol methylase
MEKLIYESKSGDYFSKSRRDLIDKVDLKNCKRVLDVGCGTGKNLAYLKSKAPLVTTIGVEPFAKVAQQEGVDIIFQCNVEEFLKNEKEKDFDLVMCLDSLEHIWAYEEVLLQLTNLMSDDGVLLISVPNISNFRTFYHLFLRRDFPKLKEGIFDETHCRWFTKKVLDTDLTKLGYTKIEFSYTGMEKGKILYFIDRLTLGLFREYIGFQIVAVARKTGC